MKLTSTAFMNNERIPDLNAFEMGNMSPPVEWCEVPEGTKSFALVMDDPDAAAVIGKTFDHWVIYNIQPNVRGIKEGLLRVAILEGVGVQGVTTRDGIGYMGPCPPKGAGEHKYIFQLYALSLAPEFHAELTKDELYDIIKGHVLAKATLTGLFSR